VNDLPTLTEPMGDWVEQALCREKVRAGEADRSWWFPGAQREQRTINIAKRICGECPVREDCLEWAVRNEQYGIWGGVGPRQREYIVSDREKHCASCHRPFVPTQPSGKYCTRRCLEEAQNVRRNERRRVYGRSDR